ncbi:hypothetical protein QFZ23_004363 [Arthrobacter globiformis]|uniref:hypothetical protein n=1 Tax=Arthrobacter globiformis TaxID=1665 RepID=UPI0027801AED|nr:hypothetical protein [Arthrobacter globiformis]MDQ1060462.1 hypothetical protein [Arthrobacter globiformis]
MSDGSHDPGNDAEDFASGVSNLFGSLAGAITGHAVSGPTGAITGAIVGPILEEAGRSVLSRILGARERRRVESVVTFATDAVNRNLEAGMTIRQDSFWQARGGFAPDAQETFEAVLVAAQRDPEERKLPFMGSAYAYISCDPAMTAAASHWLIRQAESLTWTQFQLLALVAREDELDLAGIRIGQSARNWDSVALHRELSDLGLGGRYLIHGGMETRSSGIQVPTGLLERYKLQNPGLILFGALHLRDISLSELQDLASRLRRPIEEAEQASADATS